MVKPEFDAEGRPSFRIEPGTIRSRRSGESWDDWQRWAMDEVMERVRRQLDEASAWLRANGWTEGEDGTWRKDDGNGNLAR